MVKHDVCRRPCNTETGPHTVGWKRKDDGCEHVDIYISTRHERVRGGHRGVPAVRSDDDVTDDVRRAPAARRLHPPDDQARTRRRARAGAQRTAARTAEDHLRRAETSFRPHLQHVRR